MALLSTLLDEIRPAAYGAPDPVLLRSLRRGASALLSYSQVWRETLPVIRLRQGIGRYELLAPDGAHVERIIHAKCQGRPLCQDRPGEVASLRDMEGPPRAFGQHDQDIELWPTPGPDQVGEQVTVFVALSLSRAGTAIPDGIMAEFGDAIAHRAKWDLLANAPEMPWHDPQAGSIHLQQADEGFQRAKRVQHSGHHMPLTVRPRPFV